MIFFPHGKKSINWRWFFSQWKFLWKWICQKNTRDYSSHFGILYNICAKANSIGEKNSMGLERWRKISGKEDMERISPNLVVCHTHPCNVKFHRESHGYYLSFLLNKKRHLMPHSLTWNILYTIFEQHLLLEDPVAIRAAPILPIPWKGFQNI